MAILLGAAGSCAAAANNINLPGGASSRTIILPGTSIAGHAFEVDGSGIPLGSAGSTPDWHIPVIPGIGSQFQIIATLTSGVVPNGDALDTWLNLSTFRQWFVQRNTVGTTSSTIQVSIRRTGTTIVLDSGSYSMSATCET